jgi:MoaA/NifB/PqqE/SkfB family radical SAM enzyme
MFARDSRLKRLRQWRSGKTPGPWDICLFPTNRCNLRCAICWQHSEEENGKPRKAEEVPDERLLLLADEAAELGVREWSIAGGGEPMVRPDLMMALCSRIMDRGMRGSITTNGALFAADHIEELVRRGWWRLIVSLDAATAEANDAIRVPGAYERATAMLRQLAETKRRHNTPYPEVYLNAVITNRNCEDFDALVRLAHELGVSMITANVLVVRSDKCRAFRLSGEQHAALPGHLEKAMALARELGVATAFAAALESEQARDRDGVVLTEAAPPPATFENAICFEPFLTAAVRAENGILGPCANFYDETAQSIQEYSLAEAWRGPYMQAVREAVVSRQDLPYYCAHCCSATDARTQLLREGLRNTREGPLAPVCAARYVARRGIRSLRDRGVRVTAQRAWRMLRRR